MLYSTVTTFALLSFLAYAIGSDVTEYDNEVITLESTSGTPWAAVTVDSTGKYMAAVPNQGYNLYSIYLSSDFGTTWTAASKAPKYPWWGISTDRSGKYLVAVGNCQSSGYIGCPSPYYSSDYGATWKEASGTGDVLCYSGVVNGYGSYMTSVCLYADASKGQMLGMFQSTNSGYSWNQIQPPYSVSYNGLGYPLTYSTYSNSNTLVYIIESKVWVWKQGGSYYGTSPTASWKSVAADENCTYVFAVSTPSKSSSGTFIFSSNGGQTWKTVSQSIGFNAVASNVDAKYVYLAGYDGYIYKFDYVKSAFTKTAAPKQTTWNSIDTDSTGATIIASASTTGLYVSKDYGNTWKLA